jgi:hypothetical protein
VHPALLFLDGVLVGGNSGMLSGWTTLLQYGNSTGLGTVGSLGDGGGPTSSNDDDQSSWCV